MPPTENRLPGWYGMPLPAGPNIRSSAPSGVYRLMTRRSSGPGAGGSLTGGAAGGIEAAVGQDGDVDRVECVGGGAAGGESRVARAVRGVAPDAGRVGGEDAAVGLERELDDRAVARGGGDVAGARAEGGVE